MMLISSLFLNEVGLPSTWGVCGARVGVTGGVRFEGTQFLRAFQGREGRCFEIYGESLLVM
jgi:hypothetical protein